MIRTEPKFLVNHESVVHAGRGAEIVFDVLFANSNHSMSAAPKGLILSRDHKKGKVTNANIYYLIRKVRVADS